MIYGIGTDLIEVERVHEKMNNEAFKTKLFTPQEIAYCESKKYKAQHYAARFAAKEAFFKAMGTGWYGQVSLQDVEIQHNENGRPIICLYNKAKDWFVEQKITHIHLSLSHLKSIAQAMVIIEK